MWSVFKKSLRDSRWTIFWMSFGLAVYALFVISTYPMVLEDRETFQQLSEEYMDSFGSFMPGIEDFTRPANWLHVQFTLWALLILGAMVIVQIFNGTTNAERDGTMDVMLSLPITRRAMLLGRMLNTLVSIFIVLTACYVTLLISREIWPEFDLSTGDMAIGIYTAFVPLSVLAGLTYLAAVLTPSSKRWAGIVAYLFFYGSYLLHSLSGLSEGTQDIQPIFIFEYYDVPSMINGEMNIVPQLILLGIALVMLGAAYWQMERKELAV